MAKIASYRRFMHLTAKMIVKHERLKYTLPKFNEGTYINMTLILLIILSAAEIGFLIYENIKKSSEHKTWTIRRLIVNSA
jgi:hypothetical protein